MWRRVVLEFLSRTSCRELRIGARTRRSHSMDGVDFDVAVKVHLDADRPASASDCKGQLVRRRLPQLP